MIHGAQPIQGPHSFRPAQAAGRTEPIGGDRVEISEAARLAAQAGELPAIREDLVARVRTAIAEGTYETDEKYALATERLLDELV
jgi:anti-sigma28 factor (negative regulator of flagellin synthesis)